MHDDLVFSWLHLSDIHFSPRVATKQKHQRLVLDQLVQDVEAQLKLGKTPRPDAMFITGDIAYHGGAGSKSGKGEYAQALQWIDKVRSVCGLRPEDVYVVPGNHDVVRVSGPMYKTPSGSFLDAGRREDGGVAVDDALASKHEGLTNRFDGYMKFARKLNPACADLVWSASRSARNANGLRIRILGLNTALVSNDDSDRGRLRVGHAQLESALQNPGNEREIVIALSHHPLRGGWLADEQEAGAWLRRSAHIHLYGHVHDAAIEELRRGAGDAMVEVAAGAASGDSVPIALAESFGYNFGGIGTGKGDRFELRVWPRRLTTFDKRYRVDTSLLPDYEICSRNTLSTGFSTCDCSLPPHSSDGGVEVCIPSSVIRRSLVSQTTAGEKVTDQSNLFVLLVRVTEPHNCSLCIELCKANLSVEAVNDVFGPEDIVVRARSSLQAAGSEAALPADIAALVQTLSALASIRVLDVTREHLRAKVNPSATAMTRGVKAFVYLRDERVDTDFLVRQIDAATQGSIGKASLSTFVLAVYEIAPKNGNGAGTAPTVLAECFITCGGYYDLVGVILAIEQKLKTTERRTLLAMSDWSRGSDA